MTSKAFEILTDTIASLKSKTRQDIVEDMPLESLELDSLGEFELLMALEEKLGFELDQVQLSSCRTLGDLSALINTELQHQ
jgi:acyl carrier protein